jgi:hypothetical protein
MRTIQEVLSELAPLSSVQIAVKLYRADIKGDPEHACQCPIAKYLKQETGISVLAVYGSTVWALDLEYTDTPESVREFIRDFDSHRYPLLDSNV